jgi:hypothetical protein
MAFEFDCALISASPGSPNSALQRTGMHKVLGRGRPSLTRGLAPRARVLIGWRAVAELGS